MAAGGIFSDPISEFRRRQLGLSLSQAARHAIMPALARYAWDPITRAAAMAALGDVLGALIHDASVSGEADPATAEEHARAAIQALQSAFEERAHQGRLLKDFVWERVS